MRRWGAVLTVLVFLLPSSAGSITVVSTSTPVLKAVSPPVRLTTWGTSCVLTPNANLTGGSLAIPYSGGATNYDCFIIVDDASPTRAYKMRIAPGGTNIARFDDVQIKAGGTTLIKWQSGAVATSESSWINIPGGGESITARVRMSAGAAAVAYVEVLVARPAQTTVYSVYDLTFTFAAG